MPRSSSQAYYVPHFKEKNAARPPFHCDSYTIRHNTKMVVEVVLGIADLVTVLMLPSFAIATEQRACSYQAQGVHVP